VKEQVLHPYKTGKIIGKIKDMTNNFFSATNYFSWSVPSPGKLTKKNKQMKEEIKNARWPQK
jgi:hypothetical protein